MGVDHTGGGELEIGVKRRCTESQCIEKTNAKRQVGIIVVTVVIGSWKRHNLNLNQPDFSSSATDRCAFPPWILSWTFYTGCVSMSELRPAACHTPLKIPLPLHAVRSGWAARLAWKKGSSHKTAAPSPSHHRCPAQRLQHQSKMISKKTLFLVKRLDTLRMEKSRKEQEESGSNSMVVTKLSCPLCVNMGQCLYRAMPKLTLFCSVFSTTLHWLRSKIGAPQ